MTKKDFETIARALYETQPKRDPAALRAWIRTVRAFTRMLSGTSPRFDASRFERACGLVGDYAEIAVVMERNDNL